jgi:hypothetical protein
MHVKNASWDGAAVIGRASTSSNTYYRAGYFGPGTDWELYKVVNGTSTLLGTYDQTLSAGATYTVKLDMQGSTIRLLVNGVERISVTDASITAAGRGGVRLGYLGATSVPSNTSGLHLDNLTLSQAADDSAGTNDGTYSGGVALGAGGALAGDSAAQFDGVDDYVRVAREIQDDFSIEFWFKSTQGLNTNDNWWGNAGLVDAEVAGPFDDFGVSLRSDGRITAGAGTPDVTIVSASGGYNDGNWHHVVFTRKRSTGALGLYVDGAGAGTAIGHTRALSAPANIDFGRLQAGWNHYAGSLDEVAVYDTTLGSSDVAAHYVGRVTPENWTTSESHDYKFRITLDNDLAAAGKSGTATFRWEARNR